MNRHPLLIVLLVLTHILLMAVFGSTMDFDDPGTQTWDLLAVAISFSQIALLSAWLCFGRSHFLLRLACTAAAMWGWVLIYTQADSEPLPWPLMVMSISGSVVAILFVVRWFRYAVVQQDDEPWTDADQSSFQFSIWQMLVWMTVVAASLAILKATKLHDATGKQVWELFLLGLLFGPLVITSGWYILSPRRPWWRLVVVAVHAAVAVFLFGADGELFQFGVFQIAIHLATLLVVRQCGYRLVRLSAGAVVDVGGATGLDQLVAEQGAGSHPLDVPTGEVHPLDRRDEERPQA